MRLSLVLAALLAAAIAAGCNNPAGGSSTPAQKTATKATAAKTVNLTGAVTAPAGVIATGGGNVISTGGGNLRQVLSVDEAPLAGTPVFLADGNGNKVAGVAETKTDAQGKFTFSKVPAKGNYMVVAKAMNASDKKEAQLKSLVKVGTGNASTSIGASSTMVTALTLDKLKGNLAAFDSGDFDKAVSAVAEKLTAEIMPDFSDTTDVLSSINSLSASLTELKGLLDKLEAAGVPEAQKGLDAAKDALDKAQQQIGDATVPLDLNL